MKTHGRDLLAALREVDEHLARSREGRPDLVAALREVDDRLAQKKPSRAVEERIFAASPPSPLRLAVGALPRALVWAVPAAAAAFLALEAARETPVESPALEPIAAAPSAEAPLLIEPARDEAPPAAPDPSARPAPLPILAPRDPITAPAPAPSAVPSATDRARPPRAAPDTKGPEEREAPLPAQDVSVGSTSAAPPGHPRKSAGTGAGPLSFGGAPASGPQSGGTPRMHGGLPASAGAGAPAAGRGDGEIGRPSSGGSQAPVDPDGQEGRGGDPEVHVIGIYDSYSSAAAIEGKAAVHIERPGRHILVLSAYSETAWSVTAAPGVVLERVIALGYERQSVSAPDAGAVLTVDYETDGVFGGCAYEHPDTDPTSGCETPELLASVEAITHLPAASFHGCYAGSSFLIHEDMSVSSDCWTEAGYALTGYP